MKVTHIKNVVIWALVIVNAFFLTFFLWRLVDDHSKKTEMLENLSTLMARNGISLDTENIRQGGALTELLISRDITGEQKLADTLFGQTQMTEQGGIIYTYTGKSENDRAVFKNGGVFEITFSPHVYDITINEVTTAKSLLRTMNIETVSVIAEPDHQTVTAVCAWNHQPIFNCRITFEFKDGSLARIRGTHPSHIKLTSNNTDMSSCATSLILFLNEVKAGKYSCSQITKVEPGYNFRALGDSIGPVWRIDTNEGVFYIDAVTGTVEKDTQSME